MRRFAVLALAIAFPSALPPAASAADVAAERAVDALCTTSTADRARRAATFVAIFDGRAGDGAWRRADPESLRRIAHDPNIYSEIAHVRSHRGGVTLVDIVADALDFGSRTTYCFRRSGTLARAVERSSGTTNADFETRYLDERGNVVSRSSRLTLLAPHAGASPSADVKPAKIDLYPTLDALPFAHLLSHAT